MTLTQRTITTQRGRNVTAWSDGSVTADVRDQDTDRVETIQLALGCWLEPCPVDELTARANYFALRHGIA